MCQKESILVQALDMKCRLNSLLAIQSGNIHLRRRPDRVATTNHQATDITLLIAMVLPRTSASSETTEPGTRSTIRRRSRSTLTILSTEPDRSCLTKRKTRAKHKKTSILGKMILLRSMSSHENRVRKKLISGENVSCAC
jgi:hypothetical protein